MEEDDIVAGWAERIRAASADGRPLRIRGGGTKDWYGQALDGEILDTRALQGIVSYDPAELVVTVRAGTPLAQLETALTECGQMLPFEPPHFGRTATVGGCIAAGLAGPRRATCGAPRDFVLGVTLMNGRGELLRFGGRVMKNVAGYDVARLLAGAMGTLGLLVEVSLKVLPRPVAEATLRFDLDEATAILRLNTWAGQPLPLSASCWHDGQLALRLSGARAAVDAACAALGGERMADADDFWTAVREQRHAFFAGHMPLWRLAVAPTTPPLALALGPQLIEWGGGQRWVRAPGDADTARAIRTAASAAGGHATLFRGVGAAPVFQPLAPALAQVHARLQAGFDPDQVFHRGRLFQDHHANQAR